MVETITPVVHGGRRSSYWMTLAIHTFGAGVAAAAVGGALGLFGQITGGPWGAAGLTVLASVAGLYALRESLGLRIPLPDRHRQVPEWWRTFFSRKVASLFYGLGLGAGFLTFLSFGTYVAVAAAALLSGDPLLGAVLCAPFGIARGLSVAVASATHDELGHAAVVDRLEEVASTPLPRAVNAGTLGLVAAAALLGAS